MLKRVMRCIRGGEKEYELETTGSPGSDDELSEDLHHMLHDEEHTDEQSEEHHTEE
jgi:hypothetical protein